MKKITTDTLRFGDVNGLEVTALNISLKSFESYAQGLSSFDNHKDYDIDGNLLSVTYTTPAVTIIKKTFNYDYPSDTTRVTSVVLSGDLPVGMQTTKTYTFDVDGNITDIVYSA